MRCTALLRQVAQSSSSATAQASPSQPTHHLITLLRSPHGLPKASSATLATLGLHKLHATALYPFSQAVAGKLLSVKELIRVRNVTQDEGERLMAASRNRGEGSGIEVVGRVYGGRGGAEAAR